MTETSITLLDRFRHGADDRSWQRLVDLYTPLLKEWLRRQGVQDEDSQDLLQEVFTVLIRKLPEFEYDPTLGSFRSWLRTILARCLQAHWRAKRSRPRAQGGADLLPVFEALEDPTSDLSHLFEQQHDAYVVQRLLKFIEPDFTPMTWEAFRRVALDGEKAADVACKLDLSVNAVLIAKSRVLRRLHSELAALTGDCRLS